jgi:nucleoside-diphosphate-sugar epimerase
LLEETSLRYLITGATGFVGGHVAEASAARGFPVTAVARPGSDVALLERLGVTLYRGDITDAAVVTKALDGVDAVVHCAAKVGDRGPVEDYRAVNVDALRGLLEACRGRPLHRFIHMSSLGVYEARHHHGTDESEPLPEKHWDGYTQTKVEAEHLVMRYQREHGLPVVVLRPGFVYGPRDKAVLPKLIRKMTTGKIHYLGGDRRALNTIYVGNLVEAVFLAADNPNAVGQPYNLTDGESVSKRRFIEAVADGMGLKKSKQILPRWFAAIVVRLLKRHMLRALAAGRKPLISPAQFKFLLLNLDFSIEKAKRELGYKPRYTFDEGIRITTDWYKQNPQPKAA